MIRQHAIALILVSGVICVAAGCASWGSRRRPETEVTPVPANSFAIAWKAELDLGSGRQLSELHLAGDRVIAYSGDQRSYVMSRAGGTLNHITPVHAPGGTLRPPLIVDDTIIYTTNRTLELYGLDGELRRSIELPDATGGGATANGQMVYVGVDAHEGGRVTALNLAEQVVPILWQVRTGSGEIRSRPALYQGSLYVGTTDGRVYALDARDRRQLWILEGGGFATAGPVKADVQADEEAVYAASTDSKLYALDRSTGKILWQYFAGEPLTTSPVVTDDSVYQAVPNKGVAAIDKTTGNYNRQVRWMVRDARQFLSQDSRHVYLRGRDDRIIAVDKASGQVVFTSRGRDYELFATNLADATIYAAQRNGLVVAITPVLSEGTSGQIVLREAPAALSSLASAR